MYIHVNLHYYVHNNYWLEVCGSILRHSNANEFLADSKTVCESSIVPQPATIIYISVEIVNNYASFSVTKTGTS